MLFDTGMLNSYNNDTIIPDCENTSFEFVMMEYFSLHFPQAIDPYPVNYIMSSVEKEEELSIMWKAKKNCVQVQLVCYELLSKKDNSVG